MQAESRRNGAAEDRQRWARLAELIAIADRDGMGALRPHELDEFVRLYRRTTADLAAARARGHDQRLSAHLNGLAGRAAGLIYGGRARRIDLREFFAVTIPRTFRRHGAYVAIACAIFAAPALIAFAAAAADPAWADALVAPRLREVIEEFLARDVPAGQYFADTQSVMGADNLSGMILANNLRVALMSFAYGLTAGLGTLYVLAGNGLMVGALLGLGAHHDRCADILAIIAPHGFLELFAIFMAGGAGLMIGWALIDPGDRRRVDALAAAAGEAVVVLMGALVLLGAAALIEGFVSPQTTGVLQSNGLRVLVGFTAWLALFAWLALVCGRSGRMEGCRARMPDLR